MKTTTRDAFVNFPIVDVPANHPGFVVKLTMSQWAFRGERFVARASERGLSIVDVRVDGVSNWAEATKGLLEKVCQHFPSWLHAMPWLNPTSIPVEAFAIDVPSGNGTFLKSCPAGGDIEVMVANTSAEPVNLELILFGQLPDAPTVEYDDTGEFARILGGDA